MKILSGKDAAQAIEAELRPEVAALTARGAPPCLGVIWVGEDPATEVYIRNKVSAAERVGIHSRDLHLPASTTQAELEAAVVGLNRDPAVHGILCQLPLPSQMEPRAVTLRMDPMKDVDCFHPANFGLMAMGAPRFLPCTPAGIVELLRRGEIPLAGKEVVILGRSNIVGRPLSIMLSLKGVDATVTVCHSRTPHLEAVCRRADVLIAAMGVPEKITAAMVKPGVVVVDVGIHRVDDPGRKRGYRLCGDVDQAAMEGVASALTPVPGGVGPMTITMLLRNTVRAAQLRVGGEG